MSQNPPQALVVRGCQHATIGDIVRGDYRLSGENHGRPVYKKTTQVKGNFDVLVYYWDERDGVNNSGWWFGPKVGGDQVWAYHRQRQEKVPPTSGWNVPYGGPEDPTLQLAPQYQGTYGASSVQPYQPPPPQPSSAWGAPPPPAYPSQAPGYPYGYAPPTPPPQAAWGAPPPPSQAPGYGYPPPQQPSYDYSHGGSSQQKSDRNKDGARYDRSSRDGRRNAAAMEAEQKRKADEAKAAEGLARMEELRKKEVEEMKRKAEETQRRIEENRRKIQEREKQVAEAKAKEQAEKQKAAEEARRRIEEAAKAKKELEERRHQEMKSALAIRRVIQKLRVVATSEKRAEMEAELTQVCGEELDRTGSQKEKIVQECEAVREQVRERLAKIEAARQAEIQKKEAEEKRKAEEVAVAQRCLQELESLVVNTEDSCQRMKDAAIAASVNSEKDMDKATELLATAVSAREESSDNLRKATSFIPEHLPQLRQQGIEVAKAVDALAKRLAACRQAKDLSGKAIDETSVKVKKYAAAREKQNAIDSVFKKYDKDKDGMLNKREIAAFAKGEYRFSVPESVYVELWKNYVEEGTSGVLSDDFYYLKVAVGVAREKERDVKRRKIAEEKARLLKEASARIIEKIRQLAKVVQEAEREISMLEQATQILKARNHSAADMLRIADEKEKDLGVVLSETAKAAKMWQALPENFSADLKASVVSAASADPAGKKSEMTVKRFQGRLDRIKQLISHYRQDARKKMDKELYLLRWLVFRVIRYNQRLRNQTLEELFDLFLDADGDGEADEKDFLKFFEDADCKLRVLQDEADEESKDAGKEEEKEGQAKDEATTGEDTEDKPPDSTEADKLPLPIEHEGEEVSVSNEEIARVFTSIANPDSKTLSKEAFVKLMRVFFVVVKASNMTSSPQQGGKVLRPLCEHEVLELVQGPFKAAGLLRIQVRARGDEKLGWVSMTDGKKYNFLREGGNRFKVVKATIVTDDLELDAKAPDKSVSRKLQIGEILELIEGPRKDSCGLVRIKAKFKNDGIIGWVTKESNQGTVFLQLHV